METGITDLLILKYKRFLKGLEFIFKRLVMALLSLFFTTGPKSASSTNSSEVRKYKRVLFLRFDKLGDMVISLPVFETLASELPDLQIEVIASPSSRAIIAEDSRIRAIWLYTKRPWQDLRTLWMLRKRNYDAVIDMICLDSVTALFVSQLVGRNVPRIGIGKSRFAKYYTTNIPLYESNYAHIVDTTLSVLDALGVEKKGYVQQAPLATSAIDKQRASEFINSLHSSSEKLKTNDSTSTKIIGVNISAGKPNRMWGEKKFVELLNQLGESNPRNFISLLCAPNERALAESIKEKCNCQVELIPPRGSILQVAAIISHLDILISPDTSLIHVARQYDVPVVGIYPTHGRSLAQWSPYGQPDGVVLGGSACDIFDITVQQVFQEYSKVSARTFKIEAQGSKP